MRVRVQGVFLIGSRVSVITATIVSGIAVLSFSVNFLLCWLLDYFWESGIETILLKC
jgi:hypothetical protein